MGRRQVGRPPGAEESKGRQNEYFKLKKDDYLRLINYKLSSQTQETLVKDFDILKVTFRAGGGRCASGAMKPSSLLHSSQQNIK
jgi:hypothetical protein